jgi:predicted nucleic acid-binding Zn ribbon protein
MSGQYNDDSFDDHPLESDLHDSDDLAEMFCPKCRASVTEDTQKCPHCGDWITPVERSSTGPRRIVYVAIVLFMVAMILWMWR